MKWIDHDEKEDMQVLRKDGNILPTPKDQF